MQTPYCQTGHPWPLYLSPQGPQPLLQLVLLLGGRFGGCLGVDGGGGGLAQLLVKLDASVISQLAEELVNGVVAGLEGCVLVEGFLVDVAGHGIFFSELVQLLDGEEGLRSVGKVSVQPNLSTNPGQVQWYIPFRGCYAPEPSSERAKSWLASGSYSSRC